MRKKRGDTSKKLECRLVILIERVRDGVAMVEIKDVKLQLN